MSESSAGKEVGTLFLRVVPVLDQTAMAGISQQAQSAARGAGGASPGSAAVSPGAGAAAAQARANVANAMARTTAFTPASAGGFMGGRPPGYGGTAAGGFMGPDGSIYSERTFWSNEMWNDQMGALGAPGGAGPGAGGRPPIGARSGDGGRRAASAIMFGAWEVGRAYNAYSDSLQPRNNRTGLQAARSALEASREAGSGIIGSSLTGFIRLQNNMVAAGGWQQILAEAGPLPQINKYLKGKGVSSVLDFNAAENAVDSAERAVKNTDASISRGIRTRDMDFGTSSAQSAAYVSTIRNEHGRRVVAAHMKYSDTVFAGINAEQAIRDRLGGVDLSGDDRANLQKDLDALYKSNRYAAGVGRTVRDADISNARTDDEEERSRIGAAAGLRIRARGVGAAVANARTNAIRLRMQGDDLGSIGATLDAARIGIKGMNDLNPAQQGALIGEAEASAAAGRKEAVQSNSLRLNAATRQAEWAEMRNRISPGGSYAAANLRAHAQQLYDTANDEAIFLENQPAANIKAEGAQRRRLGVAQLQNLYNSVTAGLGGFEGSARTASGGGEMASLLRRIADNTDALRGGTGSGGMQ